MTANYLWTQLMPGVYEPVFLPAATTGPKSRCRPAWFPRRIVRRPHRRYRLSDARRLPY